MRSSDETESLKIRDEQRKNGHDRARLYDAGENAIGKTPEEARQSVARLADVKVDLIKYHINGNAKDMNPETYGALVDEAKKRGFMTTVHIFNLRDAKGAVEKGTNAIVHSVRDQNVDQELIDMMKRNNVGYVPTLTRDLSVFVYENEPAFWREPFFQKGMYVYKTQVDILKDPAEQQKARTSPAVQRIKVALEQAKRNLKLLSDAGVLIGMGTDTASPNDLGRWPGYFEHTEMELMVAGRHDADAGDRGGDRERRAHPQARQHRHDRDRQGSRPRRAQREPARQHPQHAPDRLRLDRGPQMDGDGTVVSSHRAAIDCGSVRRCGRSCVR